MRVIIISIIIFTYCFDLIGQENDFLIKPGFGVSNLHLGMKATKMVEILGKPKNIRTFSEAKNWAFDLGHPVDSILEFQIGFDTAYYYDYVAKNPPAPLIAIFAKDDKINSLILNCSSYRKGWCKKFRISSDSIITFKSNIKKNQGVYKHPDKIIELSDYMEKYYSYVFVEKRIGLIYIKGKLKAINIFEPMEK